jgi:hypothetical protein
MVGADAEDLHQREAGNQDIRQPPAFQPAEPVEQGKSDERDDHEQQAGLHSPEEEIGTSGKQEVEDGADAVPAENTGLCRIRARLYGIFMPPAPILCPLHCPSFLWFLP